MKLRKFWAVGGVRAGDAPFSEHVTHSTHCYICINISGHGWRNTGTLATPTLSTMRAKRSSISMEVNRLKTTEKLCILNPMLDFDHNTSVSISVADT